MASMYGRMTMDTLHAFAAAQSAFRVQSFARCASRSASIATSRPILFRNLKQSRCGALSGDIAHRLYRIDARGYCLIAATAIALDLPLITKSYGRRILIDERLQFI